MELITQAFESLDNPDLVFVALDIETTGFSYYSDRILEIGAVRFTTERTLDFFEQLINPQLDQIPSNATDVHGITLEMVKDKPTLKEVLPRFLEFCQNAILVAHNANFDLNFIKSGLAAHGLGRDLPHRVVDTLVLARVAFPGRESYKLQDLAHDLNITAYEAHRAKDDARVCAEVFLKGLQTLNPGRQGNFL